MSEEVDAKQIGEILDVVTDRLPKLFAGIRESFLSESAGRDFGKAVGAFYKELVGSGIPADAALKMATEYIGTIKGALSQIPGSSGQIRVTKGDDACCRPSGGEGE